MARLAPKLVVAALVGVAFFAGLVSERVAEAARRSGGYKPLDVFSDALVHVLNSYVEEVSEEELVYGAVDGLVARLDPHSAFLRPAVYEQVRDETTGEFDGLGLEVSVEKGALVVIAPMAESPGERAGIRPGDVVVSIDGASAKELTLAEATRRMKGPAGTKVVLEIMREGFAAPQKLTLVRDRIRTQSVDWRVLDPDRRIVHARVKVFQERTDRSLEKALEDARLAMKGEIRGLVLDLRNNPGGLLLQGVHVADLFLATGTIVSTEGRGRATVEVERAHEKGTEPAYPIIVLVNRGTASASEIVAGALQDHGRAVIMGTQTFGKGSVQSIIELEDGSGLKLTTARYYTPRRRSIQESGITPDVVVPEVAPPLRAEDAPGERDLRRHLRNGEKGAGAVAVPASVTAAAAAGDDHQLRTALDYLRAADILKPGSDLGRDVARKGGGSGVP